MMFGLFRRLHKEKLADQHLRQWAIQNKWSSYPSSTGLRDVKTNERVFYEDPITGDVWKKSNYKEMARKQLVRQAASAEKSRIEREARERQKVDLIKDLESCLGHSVIEPHILIVGDKIIGGVIYVNEYREDGTLMQVRYSETPLKDGWYKGDSCFDKHNVYLRNKAIN